MLGKNIIEILGVERWLLNIGDLGKNKYWFLFDVERRCIYGVGDFEL